MAYHRRDEETLTGDDLRRVQREKLAAVLDEVRRADGFYGRRLADCSFDARSDPIERLPLTTRADLERDQREHPPYGTIHTLPLAAYTRFHQTSGTGSSPLRCLDTADGWAWWLRCWSIVFRGAGLTDHDRVMFPFSFGPFIGFWAAFEAASGLGNLCLPAGGMTTVGRLGFMLDNDVTVVCCTPTYALRMAEVAGAEGFDLAGSAARLVVVAGEPGGSEPAVRARIESAWGARVIDHAGMTEIGAWGFECEESPGGMHVIESEFIAEVVDPTTGASLPDGESGELVLTNLGRRGLPLIRYRTGDDVSLTRGPCACGRWFARAEGGVRGRIDDMLVVRGVNVFPSAIEGILREHADVAEFRITVDDGEDLAALGIEIETVSGTSGDGLVERVTASIRDRLHFRPEVSLAASGSLPRFEMKARRVVRTPHSSHNG